MEQHENGNGMLSTNMSFTGNEKRTGLDMDTKQIFYILGIEQTKDEGLIRDAYHRELEKHHPEEDPEGFKALREAYEEALRYVRTNEDENPETNSSDEKEWDETDAVGRFMKKTREIYIHYGQRICPEAWEELLRDPVVKDFDREEELRVELFRYLAEHFRLVETVWKKLDDVFFFTIYRNDFVEFLPEGFVDYMIRRTEEDQDEYLLSEILGYPEEDKEGSIDAFIEELYGVFDLMYEVVSVGRFTPEGEERFTQFDQALRKLQGYGIRHPYLNAFELYQKVTKKREAAGERDTVSTENFPGQATERTDDSGEKENVQEGELAAIRKLLESYPENDRMDFLLLFVLHDGGFRDALEEMCRGRCEEMEKKEGKDGQDDHSYNSYYAYLFLAEICMAKEEYGDAFHYYTLASFIAVNDATEKGLKESGEKERQVLEAKEEMEEKEKLHYLEVCARSGQAIEGISFMEAHPDLQSDTAQFHYFMGILYSESERNEEALRECDITLEMLAQEEDKPAPESPAEGQEGEESPESPAEGQEGEESPESPAEGQEGEESSESPAEGAEKADEPESEEDKKQHYISTYMLKVRVLINMAKEYPDTASERRKKLEEAEEDVLTAEGYSQDEKDVSFKSFLVEVLRERKDDSQADRILELCRQILEKEPDHYYAIVSMQAAYYAKKNAQPVVDLYHRARALWEKSPEIYERATRVFLEFGQFDDALDVLKEAGESEVTSPWLKVYGFYAEGMLAQNREEWQKAINTAQQIIEELSSAEQKDTELLGYAYYYRALLYSEPQWVKKNPTGEQAEHMQFLDLEKVLEYHDIAYVHYMLGGHYMDMIDRLEDRGSNAAKDLREKAYTHLKLYADQGGKGVWLFWTLANLSEDRDRYKDAIRYMKSVIESTEDANDQISRIGEWYRYLYLETSVEEYGEEALKYLDLSDQKAGVKVSALFDRGQVCLRRGEFEKAIEAFTRMTKEIGKEDDISYVRRLTGAAYRSIGIACQYSKRYKEALQNFEMALRIFDYPELIGRTPGVYRSIYECYRDAKKGAEGVAYFEELLKKLSKRHPGYHEIVEDTLEELEELAFLSGDYDLAISYLKRRCGKSLDMSVPAGKKWVWKSELERFDRISWAVRCYPGVLPFTMEDLITVCRKSLDREGEPEALKRLSEEMQSEEPDGCREDAAPQKKGDDRGKWKQKREDGRQQKLHKGDVAEVKGYAGFLCLLGELMTIYGTDPGQAWEYLDRAQTAAELIPDEFEDTDRIYKWKAWNAYLQNDREDAAVFADRYIDEWTKGNSFTKELGISMEEAVETKDWIYKRANLYSFGVRSILKNDPKKLKFYIELMEQSRMCTYCGYCDCYELFILKAWSAYLDGRKEEALRMCRIAEGLTGWDDLESVWILERMIQEK